MPRLSRGFYYFQHKSSLLALNNNLALCYESGNRPDTRKRGHQYGTDNTDGQRQFNNRIIILTFDDNTSHIAFGNQLFDFFQEPFAVNHKFFSILLFSHYDFLFAKNIFKIRKFAR